MAVGVPLVPAGISGTGTLLPPDGATRRPRRATVTVRIGVTIRVATPAERPDSAGEGAVIAATAEARAQVVALLAGQAGSRGQAHGRC